MLWGRGEEYDAASPELEKDLSEFNQTCIVLIPKCKNPGTPKEFWPISLCNMVMKLVTKTIANWSKCCFLK